MLRSVGGVELLCVTIEPDFKLLLSWLTSIVGWFLPGIEHAVRCWIVAAVSLSRSASSVLDRNVIGCRLERERLREEE